MATVGCLFYVFILGLMFGLISFGKGNAVAGFLFLGLAAAICIGFVLAKVVPRLVEKSRCNRALDRALHIMTRMDTSYLDDTADMVRKAAAARAKRLAEFDNRVSELINP